MMTMSPSLYSVTIKLSKLQREFLIDHVDGLRPFINAPIENATRESLVERSLIKYHPNSHSILGIPQGTVLTEDGREALCYILGNYADALMRAFLAKEPMVDPRRELELRNALQIASKEWKRYELYQQSLTPPKPIGNAYNRPSVSTKS